MRAHWEAKQRSPLTPRCLRRGVVVERGFTAVGCVFSHGFDIENPFFDDSFTFFFFFRKQWHMFGTPGKGFPSPFFCVLCHFLLLDSTSNLKKRGPKLEVTALFLWRFLAPLFWICFSIYFGLPKQSLTGRSKMRVHFCVFLFQKFKHYQKSEPLGRGGALITTGVPFLYAMVWSFSTSGKVCGGGLGNEKFNDCTWILGRLIDSLWFAGRSTEAGQEAKQYVC